MGSVRSSPTREGPRANGRSATRAADDLLHRRKDVGARSNRCARPCLAPIDPGALNPSRPSWQRLRWGGVSVARGLRSASTGHVASKNWSAGGNSRHSFSESTPSRRVGTLVWIHSRIRPNVAMLPSSSMCSIRGPSGLYNGGRSGSAESTGRVRHSGAPYVPESGIGPPARSRTSSPQAQFQT